MTATQNSLVEQIERSIAVKKALLEMTADIEAGSMLAVSTLQQGRKIMLCGNGGSAADAQHIAAELVVRYKSGNDRAALPAMTLSADPSTITACSNDYGFELLFARSLEAWAVEGDLLIAISTSGNSNNIIRAIEVARKKKVKVVSLLGNGGGKMKGMADLDIIVPSSETARIQESHILIGHLICSVIEKELFNLD